MVANYTTNPVTGIKVPTPGVDPGEEYAVFVSDALNKLSSLTHTGAANLDGYQIPTDGLNINADLPVQGHNITNLRSTRYDDNSTVLTGIGDLDCVYFKGGDLWINNGDGVPIQITAGGSVVLTSLNNWRLLDISANHTINSADLDIVFSVNSSSNTVIVTLPLANSVPAGHFYFIKDRLGTSQTHNITVNPNGSDTIDGYASYLIEDNHAGALLIGDGVSNWLLMPFDRKVYDGETITMKNGSKFDLTGQLDVNGSFFMTGGFGSNITLSGVGTINVNHASAIAIDGYSVLNNDGVSLLNGIVAMAPKLLVAADSPYNVPTSVVTHSVFLCNSVGGPITINLPPVGTVPSGAIIIIKDSGGHASTNNIIVAPNGFNNLEGLNASKSIVTDWGQISLIRSGSISWVMI